MIENVPQVIISSYITISMRDFHGLALLVFIMAVLDLTFMLFSVFIWTKIGSHEAMLSQEFSSGLLNEKLWSGIEDYELSKMTPSHTIRSVQQPNKM